ncbi:MAG: ATP-binding protein [Bacteroidales bacterium]|nr:ATP-binding protein [Bacteroidales bacterium]
MIFKAHNIGVFNDISMEIPKLTLLAGCNGSGKSTISKSLYLMLNGVTNFENYLSIELYDQLDAFGKEIEKEFKNNTKKSIIDKTELLKNSVYNKLEELRTIIKNTVIDEKVLNDILVFFKENRKYSDSKNIDLLDEYLSKGNESEMGETLLSRMINSEFSNQLCNFNSQDMEILLEEGDNKAYIKYYDKKYQFYFNDFDISSIHYFGSSSSLDRDGFLLDNPMRYLNIIDIDHIIYLIMNLRKGKESYSVKDELAQKEFVGIFDPILTKIIGGGFEYDSERKEIFYNDGSHRVDLKNVASGAKVLGTLELLIKNGCIDTNSMIIIDEPENSLHPMWQVKFAKVIVELVAKTSIKVFINSHSPFFIDALNQISSKYSNLNDNVKFYQTTYEKDEYKVLDCTENINELFVTLAEPYDYLEKELQNDLD